MPIVTCSHCGVATRFLGSGPQWPCPQCGQPVILSSSKAPPKGANESSTPAPTPATSTNPEGPRLGSGAASANEKSSASSSHKKLPNPAGRQWRGAVPSPPTAQSSHTLSGQVPSSEQSQSAGGDAERAARPNAHRIGRKPRFVTADEPATPAPDDNITSESSSSPRLVVSTQDSQAVEQSPTGKTPAGTNSALYSGSAVTSPEKFPESTAISHPDLPPRWSDPDWVRRHLPPRFRSERHGWEIKSAGPNHRVVLPDGQGGTVEVDRRTVQVEVNGELVTLVVPEKHVLRRRRIIFNLVAMLICLLILYQTFMWFVR